jgi:hypothetical protein
MDPLNPIVPHSDLTARIPPSPAVPRLSPDEQRQQARDDEHTEHEPEEENSDASLEAATSEDFSATDALLASGAFAAADGLVSSEEFFIPEMNRTKPKPPSTAPAQDRRSPEDEGDDEEPGPAHINIIA